MTSKSLSEKIGSFFCQNKGLFEHLGQNLLK